jgi:hypothetical protein
LRLGSFSVICPSTSTISEIRGVVLTSRSTDDGNVPRELHISSQELISLASKLIDVSDAKISEVEADDEREVIELDPSCRSVREGSDEARMTICAAKERK